MPFISDDTTLNEQEATWVGQPAGTPLRDLPIDALRLLVSQSIKWERENDLHQRLGIMDDCLTESRSNFARLHTLALVMGEEAFGAVEAEEVAEWKRECAQADAAERALPPCMACGRSRTLADETLHKEDGLCDECMIEKLNAAYKPPLVPMTMMERYQREHLSSVPMTRNPRFGDDHTRASDARLNAKEAKLVGQPAGTQLKDLPIDALRLLAMRHFDRHIGAKFRNKYYAPLHGDDRTPALLSAARLDTLALVMGKEAFDAVEAEKVAEWKRKCAQADAAQRALPPCVACGRSRTLADETLYKDDGLCEECVTVRTDLLERSCSADEAPPFGEEEFPF